MKTVKEINEEFTKTALEIGDKEFKVKLFQAELPELYKKMFSLQDDYEELRDAMPVEVKV